MIKAKVAFSEGRHFSSQLEFYSLIGWIKLVLQKSHFCFDHVNTEQAIYAVGNNVICKM